MNNSCLYEHFLNKKCSNVCIFFTSLLFNLRNHDFVIIKERIVVAFGVLRNDDLCKRGAVQEGFVVDRCQRIGNLQRAKRTAVGKCPSADDFESMCQSQTLQIAAPKESGLFDDFDVGRNLNEPKFVAGAECPILDCLYARRNGNLLQIEAPLECLASNFRDFVQILDAGDTPAIVERKIADLVHCVWDCYLTFPA